MCIPVNIGIDMGYMDLKHQTKYVVIHTARLLLMDRIADRFLGNQAVPFNFLTSYKMYS